MARRTSSGSEGEVNDAQHKANSLNHFGERTINGPGRFSSRNGSSNNYASYRDVSRSPSPYRSKRAPRARSPSPYRRSRRDGSLSPQPFRHSKRSDSRSPSPYRRNKDDRGPDGSDPRADHKRKAPYMRGERPEKRHHNDRDRHDSRRSKPDNRDARASRNHDRGYPKPVSYADIEHPPAVPSMLSGLDVPLEHKRSTSPYRAVSLEQRVKSLPTETASKAKNGETHVTAASAVAKAADPSLRAVASDAPAPTADAVMEDAPPAEESREEKRRRWARIREEAQKAQAQNSTVTPGTTKTEETAEADSLHNRVVVRNLISSVAPTTDSVSPAASPRIGDLDSVPASPDVMIVDKQGGSAASSPAADSPSAANYDPTQDMLDDRDRAAKKAQRSELPSEDYNENALSELPVQKAVPVKKQKKDFDMFDFDEDEDEVGDDDEGATLIQDSAKGTVLDEKLLDNWDDPEGYYKLVSNELVNDKRYRMIKTLGRGVFANVAQAEDVKTNDPKHKVVAIKMIRRNDMMRKASQKELDFLRKVNAADPNDKRHIVRMLDSFDHKGHLCLVFEHMSKNLRDLLKEDTSGHGLSIPAVRSYSRQIFSGLLHLQVCEVLHCDLKPDNILVSADKKTVKLADFGTAIDKRDNMERTAYLVSRFYRAPEIILGMDIGHAMDMWAIGCTIYELWTSKILFAGRSNNQMIKAFMDCLGWPSEKLLKKGNPQYVGEHFISGPPLIFLSTETDKDGNVSTRKIEQQKKIPRDLKTRIHEAARGITQNKPSVAELNDFADLLGACLNLNVEKRIQPKEALQHRFFTQNKLAPKSAVIKPPTVHRAGSGFRR